MRLFVGDRSSLFGREAIAGGAVTDSAGAAPLRSSAKCPTRPSWSPGPKAVSNTGRQPMRKLALAVTPVIVSLFWAVPAVRGPHCRPEHAPAGTAERDVQGRWSTDHLRHVHRRVLRQRADLGGILIRPAETHRRARSLPRRRDAPQCRSHGRRTARRGPASTAPGTSRRQALDRRSRSAADGSDSGPSGRLPATLDARRLRAAAGNAFKVSAPGPALIVHDAGLTYLDGNSPRGLRVAPVHARGRGPPSARYSRERRASES